MLQKILELTTKLVSFESTQYQLAELQSILDLVVKEFENTQFQTREFGNENAPSLLITNDSQAQDFRVILNAHLDVVTAKKSQYDVSLKGDKFYGRGTFDMKAAAAVMIIVFKELAKKLDYPLALQLVTDEEIGGKAGTAAQLESGIGADFAIIGEPTGLKVAVKSKGVIKAKLTALGKSAHGARPWEGDSAILKMARQLVKFKSLSMSQNYSVWETTVDPAMISTSNQEFNKVADNCEVILDIRYTPEDGSDRVISGLERQLLPGVKLEIISIVNPQLTNPENRDIALLSKILESRTGQNSNLIQVNYGTDAKYFSKSGIPVVLFGPSGAGEHTDTEWVSVQSLEDYYGILREFLLQLR